MRASVLGFAFAAGLPCLAVAHHAAPVVIVTPGAAGPIYTGRPAHVPLTLLPSAAAESGRLEPDGVIAVRTLRPDAVVLQETVTFERLEIAAGTVMVRAELDGDVPAGAPRRGGVCCSMRLMPAMHSATQDCLEDPDGDGRFKSFWIGYTEQKNAPFTLIGLDVGRLLPAPVAYRPARPEEVPSVHLGYRLCRGEGDGQSIPYRFSPVLTTARGDWTAPARPCPFGQWPNRDDKTTEEVDGLTLKIGAGTPPTYAVTKTLSAGPLGPVRIGRSVRAKGSTSVKAERMLEAIGARPLLPVGAAQVTRQPTLAHGEDLASVEVRHGVTGVLSSDVQLKGLFGETLPAGSYVFGVPMRTGSLRNPRSGEVDVTWCAPRLEPVEGKMRVSTTCFVSLGESLIATRVGPALMVTNFALSTGRPVVGFAVERRPASFGAPMQLAYVFDHWVSGSVAKDKFIAAAQVGAEIRVNGIMTPIGHLLVAPNDAGVVALPLMGGAISLTPVGKDGAPVKLPAQIMTREQRDAFMAEIDARRARPALAAALADKPVLPIIGIVGYEPKSEPTLTELSRSDPLNAPDAAPAAPPSGPGAP